MLSVAARVGREVFGCGLVRGVVLSPEVVAGYKLKIVKKIVLVEVLLSPPKVECSGKKGGL